MPTVYTWPPVRAGAKKWTINDPVMVSKSGLTGAKTISAAQRRRRVATVVASARFSPYQSGAGYMEGLKRLLKGGVNLVRLYHRTATFDDRLIDQRERGGAYFSWVVPPAPFTWTTPPDPFGWYSEPAFTVGSYIGFPTLEVTGLPANKLIALPGEYVQIFNFDETDYETRFVLREAWSNGDGEAVIMLIDAPTMSGRLIIGGYETGVFEADELPEVVEPAGVDWEYTWNFTEVFEDERGTFTELNPWI